MAKRNINAATSMLNIIKAHTAPNPAHVPNIVFGVVKTVEPLSISIDNKAPITEQFLIVSPLCELVKHLHIVPFHTTETGCNEHPHTHDILPFDTNNTFWRGLEVGDNVMMLRINNGQTYYVMQKYNGIIWECEGGN